MKRSNERVSATPSIPVHRVTVWLGSRSAVEEGSA